MRRAVIANEHGTADRAANARRRHQGELRFRFGFGHEIVGLGHLAVRLGDFRLCGGELAFAFFKLALRDDLLFDQGLALLDGFCRRLDIAFLKDQ